MYALTTDHQTTSTPGGAGAPTGSVAGLGTVGMVVIVAAAMVGATLAAISWSIAGVLLVASLTFAAVAASIDVRVGRLPDRLVVAAAVPGLALVAAEIVTGHAAPAVTAAALGAVALAGPLFVVHLISPAGLGFGDVKLGLALGLVLGLVDPRLGVAALCLATGGTAAVGLSRRRASMPLGPGLVLGAIVALVIAGQLGGAALPWR